MYLIRENGKKYTINYMPPEKLPVKEYLKIQGRFKHLKEDQIEYIQKMVDDVRYPKGETVLSASH
jgi:pyruvate/2-oxoacid:ferredoxin oxidoreductase beta subunit